MNDKIRKLKRKLKASDKQNNGSYGKFLTAIRFCHWREEQIAAASGLQKPFKIRYEFSSHPDRLDIGF